ncbi:MAG: endonuclease III [Acidobacteria bacterium]|nr:endonuclease III [Acidobacteriota bacterium]
MPRGIVPRQPSKSGRHTGVKRVSGAASAVPPRNGRGAPVAKQPAAKPAPKSAKPAKGYDPLAPERVREILKRLDERYPNATCALHHNSAWELLVATILSAQCTDARVNMVTPVLFKKYPTPADFAALRPEQLEPDIRSTGFFRNKSKSLVGAAKAVVDEFGGQVPDDMEKLLTVPGVARKTANVVLGTWFHNATGVVVDTHVRRITRRLELTKNEDPEKIEQDLMRVIPKEKWIDFAHQIIHHGRQLCVARMPKCAECPLENLCHATDKTWSTVDIHKSATP